MHSEAHPPYLIAINLTRRCNLDCAHCYIDATKRLLPQSTELTKEDLLPVFAQLAQRAPGTIVVLTGGEPLLHPDLDELVSGGAQAGLKMVLGTNGLKLNDAKVGQLKALGLSGVGISLDGVNAAQHDDFRGVKGSFERTQQAFLACHRHDLHAQLHFTVTQKNQHQLGDVVKMGRELHARLINFFFLICIGRGKSTIDLNPNQYEEALHEIARLQSEHTGVMIQPRCAPHFKRILYQEDPDSPYTRASGYDGGGCPAGTRYCRINYSGDVNPCPYMEAKAGNIRETPFWQIWDRSPLFESLREPVLSGRCGACEFRALCGGCRARSLAQGGDLMGEDPNCSYLPQGGPCIPSSLRLEGDTEIFWTPSALSRFEKIPAFLQGLVKKNLEKKARALNVPITVGFMKEYKASREKELGFKFK